MAVVFEPTKGLTDKPFHYCPGCCHGINPSDAHTTLTNTSLATWSRLLTEEHLPLQQVSRGT